MDDGRPGRGSNAYHEAGHTAACLAMHLPLESVDIVHRGELYGQILVEEATEDGPVCFDYAVMSLAGPAAECRYDQGCACSALELQNYFLLSGERDDQIAYEQLERSGLARDPNDLPDLFIACRQKAVALVEDQWALITAIGKALLLRETLDAHDVQSIVMSVNQGQLE